MESPHGLTSAEVDQRRLDGHVNETDSHTSRSLVHIFRANVLTRFNAILGTLFLVVLAVGSVADGLFGLVLVANTLLGTGQEWKAKRTLDKIRLLHTPTSHVVRSGVTVEIPTSEIVLDDVVLLRAGDQIPVDGRVLNSHNLEINEANLTGEADSVHKEPGQHVLSSTFVTAGDGHIVATAVGRNCYAQRLAYEAKFFSPASSEMYQSINRLLSWTVWSIVALAPIQVWTQIRVEDADNWRDAIIRSVAGLVGIIPEGLVVLTTLTFLTAAVQLTRQQVLVQQLPAVETLARVNVLCVDKTGTLTTGVMRCTSVDFVGTTDSSLASRVLGHLCDDPAANSTLRAIGERFPPHHTFTETNGIPFDSQRKWKAVQLAEYGTWFLGAPEMLLPDDQELQKVVHDKAEQGQRVLLLALSHLDLSSHALPADLSAAAIISIEEEIRQDAAATIEFFHRQHVEVFILSGDHPTTVAAIAQKIGVNSDHVFGRVTPEQKREFVQERHRNNDVVAMTGDGVNDVLALKNADIGIAMNNAAPATKAVSELILLDGKFSHLPTVIDEGRRVIGNVERVAHVFLTKNVMSIVAIISVALSSRQFPFLPRQMTLVSSLAIGIPAFFLAIGSSSQRYIPGLLQRVMTFALPAGLITGISVIFTDAVSHPADGTAASICALISFLWIISLFARPISPARLALLAAMATCALIAIGIPVSTEFFAFSVQQGTVLPGLIGGLCAGFLIELTHRIHQKR